MYVNVCLNSIAKTNEIEFIYMYLSQVWFVFDLNAVIVVQCSIKFVIDIKPFYKR